TAKDPFHRYNSVHEMEDALVQSLDPSFANVAKYTPPFEAGEETKAIPVITDDQLKDASADETLVHHAGETKKVEEKPVNVEEKDAKPKKKKRFRKTKITKLILALIIISVISIVLFTIQKEVEISDKSE